MMTILFWKIQFLQKVLYNELKILMKICVYVEYCKSYMNYTEDNFDLFDYI